MTPAEQAVLQDVQRLERIERLGTTDADRQLALDTRNRIIQFAKDEFRKGQEVGQSVSDFGLGIIDLAARGFNSAQEFLTGAASLAEQGASAIASDAGPDGSISRVGQNIQDGLQFADTLVTGNTGAQVDPATQAQLAGLDALNGVQDPLAGGQPIQTGPTDPSLTFPAPAFNDPTDPEGLLPQLGGRPTLPGPTQGDLLAISDQIAASRAAEVQNAIDVDNLRRAAISAQLVTTPQAQFTTDQTLSNLALQGQAVPTDLFSAVPALQQVTPEVSAASVQPAITQAANQEIRVNSQVQSAEEQRRAALQEQRLRTLQRKRLLDFIRPQLSAEREVNN